MEGSEIGSVIAAVADILKGLLRIIRKRPKILMNIMIKQNRDTLYFSLKSTDFKPFSNISFFAPDAI